MGTMNKKHALEYLFLFIISLVILLLYFRYSFGFVSWDHFFLLGLSGVHSFRDFVHLLVPRFVHPGTGWRPLYWCIMGIPYLFSGDSPMAYQVMKIFVHLINICLVYYFSRLFTDDKRVRIAASALFAFHPCAPEAIAIACEIDDMAMTSLIMLSLYFYIKHDRDNKTGYFVLSVLAYFTAQFIREPSAVIIPLIIVYDLIIGQKKFIKIIKCYAPYLMILFIYLFFRSLILGKSSGEEIRYFSSVSFIDTFEKIIYYFRDLVIPLDMGVLRSAFRSVPSLIKISATGVSFFVVFLFIYFRKQKKFIYLTLSIITSLSIILILQLSVSRRYLYPAAVFFSILFPLVVFKIFRTIKYGRVISIFFLGVYMICQIVTFNHRNGLYAYTGKLTAQALIDIKRELLQPEPNSVILLAGIPGFCENTHSLLLAPEWKIRYVYRNPEQEVITISSLDFSREKLPDYQLMPSGEDGFTEEIIQSRGREALLPENREMFASEVLERKKTGEITKQQFFIKNDLFKGKNLYIIGLKKGRIALIALRDNNGIWKWN